MATRLLITGARGFVGSHLVRWFEADGRYEVWSSRDGPCRSIRLDLDDPRGAEADLLALAPHVIIHAAAIASLAACDVDPIRASSVNSHATGTLARAAARLGARFVLLSTDQVFDGTAAPYAEDAPATPSSVYGHTKAAAEAAVLAADRRHAVIRTALTFGRSPQGSRTALEAVLDAIQGGGIVRLFADEWRTPIWIDDLCRAARTIVEGEASGMFHAAGPDRLTRLEFGHRVCRAQGVDPTTTIIAASRLDMPPPPRPADVSLMTRRLCDELGWRPTPMDTALADLLARHERTPPVDRRVLPQ